MVGSSLFGPGGNMQEAAATAFRQGSRAAERKRLTHNPMALRVFPPVHARADAYGICTIGAWGVITDSPKGVPIALPDCSIRRAIQAVVCH